MPNLLDVSMLKAIAHGPLIQALARLLCANIQRMFSRKLTSYLQLHLDTVGPSLRN